MTEFLLLGLTQNPDVQKLLFSSVYPHLLSHCGRQPTHHCEQSPLAEPGVSHHFFLSFLSLHRPLLLFYHGPPDDIWLTCSQESHLLQWVKDSALCRAFLWRSWDPCLLAWPHDHFVASLWPTMNRQGLPGGHAWGWRISSCSDPNSFYSLVIFLWSQCHWPFHLWPFPSAETSLHGHSHLWSFCCCQQWADVYAHLFYSYHVPCAHPLL